MSVVLITGVSRYLGSRLAAQLAADPSVERVIGIDSVSPGPGAAELLGRAEFVRGDIRNPLIARVISQAAVDTVVHAGVIAPPRSLGGRSSAQESNVVGTMQLLAACQKSDDVRKVVLESSTAVYGASSADPAVFTEDTDPVGGSPRGYARDSVEIEGFVRGFARRRPDIAVSVLRFAPLLGPSVDSPIARYLRAPVVPAVAGFDPRVQVVHESDAVEVLRLATVTDRAGTVNVAAEGVLPLSQLVRLAGRLRLPVPRTAVGWAGRLVRNPSVHDVEPDQLDYLCFGRVVDTTRLRDRFGYAPRFTGSQAVAAFAATQRALPRLALPGSGRFALPGTGRFALPGTGRFALPGSIGLTLPGSGVGSRVVTGGRAAESAALDTSH